MSTRKALIENSGTLAEAKGKDGVFPIRIITEGKGSSGIYSRELLEKSTDTFAGRPMFMNHPVNPDKPHERDLLTAAARISPVVEYKVVNGVAGLYSDATVRKEYRDFVEEFADVIGVSVYVAGTGFEDDNGYQVESFDNEDPYRSVDFVVAPGRGGAVGDRAIEAYRQIESSIGKPDGTGPAKAGADKLEKENKPMDEQKLIEAFTSVIEAHLKPLIEKVEAQSTLLESVTAGQSEKTDAIKVADEVVEALSESKLPKNARARVIEAVVGGKNAKEAVESEVKEFQEALEEFGVSQGRVRITEGDKNDEDFSVGSWN